MLNYPKSLNKRTNMKLTICTTLLIASVTFSSCNQIKSNSSNSETVQVSEGDNWTKEQKETIFMISKSSANANESAEIRKHAEDIARKTLEECISSYPKYEDFGSTRKLWYDIFKKTSNSYLK